MFVLDNIITLVIATWYDTEEGIVGIRGYSH